MQLENIYHTVPGSSMDTKKSTGAQVPYIPSPPARPPLCQLIPGLLPLCRWCRMAASPPIRRHLRVIPSWKECESPFLSVLS